MERDAFGDRQVALRRGRNARPQRLLRMALVLLIATAGIAAWAHAYPRAAALAEGDWWLRAGDVPRAESAYQRYLSLRGNSPEAVAGVGARFMGAKQWPKAAGYLERAVAADPNHPARLDLGAVYEELGRDADAERMYREALRRRPGDPIALNYLGYFYARRGYRLGPAIAMLRRALDLAPDEGAIIDSLGWALYQHGDLPAALRQLQRAVRTLPGVGEVRYHLGVALARANMRDRALVELGKAVLQDPGLEEARDALRQARAGKRPPVPLVPPGLQRPSEPDEETDELTPQGPEAPPEPPALTPGRTI